MARKWLCSSSALFSNSEPGCYCDIECILFDDCCVDAFNTTDGLRVDNDDMEDILKDPVKLYEQISKPSLETSYLNLFYAYSSCHRLKINNSDLEIVLIDSCPGENPKGVDLIFGEKCNNSSNEVLGSIPVTLEFSVNWQIAFLNIFCAFCHGFKKEDIVLWNGHAECMGGVNLTKPENIGSLISRSCFKVFEPPDHAGKLRRCIMESDLKSKCLTTSDNTTDSIACPVYFAPVLFGDQIYKNIHCAYCDRTNVSINDFVHAISNVHQAIMSNTPQQGLAQVIAKPEHVFEMIPTARPAPSMKILFDFSFQAGLAFSIDGSSNVDKTGVCKDDEIYDIASDTCKTIVCPPDLVLKKGRCQYETWIFNDEEKVLPVTSDGDDVLIVSIISRVYEEANADETIISQSYSVTLDELLTNYVNRKYTNSSNVVKVLFNETSSQTVSSLGDNRTQVSCLHIKPEGILELSEVIEVVTKFTRLISRCTLPRSSKVLKVSLSNRNFDESVKCPEDRHVAHLRELTMDTTNDTVYFIDRRMNVANKALNTIYSLGFVPGSDKPLVQDVVFCSNLVCPQTKLSDEEYTFDNLTLQILSSGKHLSPKEYDMRNNSIYVCVPPRRLGKIPLTSYFDMPNALLIQTVTYSLSIVALILTILIYIKYVSVRTLHGKTLVSMSASLIGAQLTGILPLASGNIWCKLVAIVTHFSWLSAFGWMSMISYNMVTTFFGKQTTVTNTHIDRKRYFAYSFVGWLLPGLIVITCIVLDDLNVPRIVQVGYGEGLAGCFISGKGLFIFFSLPHLISVLFNTVAFFLTVYGITRKRKVVPNSKRSKDRWFFLIYVKLSVVMGVAWIVAILASITHQMFLWYIHFVLNGLQGVFIFISFALRATIWKQMSIKKLKKPHKVTLHSKRASFYSVSGNSITMQ